MKTDENWNTPGVVGQPHYNVGFCFIFFFFGRKKKKEKREEIDRK
jgi:hypothetical protein